MNNILTPGQNNALNGMQLPYSNAMNNWAYNTMQQNPQPVLKPVEAFPQIVTVAGEEAIKNLNLPPNQKGWWLDASGNMVWVVQTDGVGYKTIECYDIIPHKDPPSQQELTQNQFAAIEKRLSKLEERLNRPQQNSQNGSKGGSQ